MDIVLAIQFEKIIPSKSDILAGQGIPETAAPNERTLNLVNCSLSIYKETVNPVGIIKEISIDDFKNLYQGEGKNEDETPLEPIARNADNMALFVATIGEEISLRIKKLFNGDDFAAGSMLDAAASVGADMASRYMEIYYANHLKENQLMGNSAAVMRFSPGYCGWHVSGQKKLFDYLEPERIGINLTDSFLMVPLKSVSGVVVSGDKSIFEFDNNFIFCADCADKSCLERQKSLMVDKT